MRKAMAAKRRIFWIFQIIAILAYVLPMPAQSVLAAEHPAITAPSGHMQDMLHDVTRHDISHRGMIHHGGTCCGFTGCMCAVLLFVPPELPEMKAAQAVEPTSLPSWSEAPVFSFPHPPQARI